MRPMGNYKPRMRRILKKFKSMVKKHGILGVLLLLGGLSGNCGTDIGPIPVLYGPPPITKECSSNQDCITKYGSNWYCDLNEASPICKCGAVALYGPQGCTTDEQCQSQNGADWYCDLTNAYDDGCGGTVTWPVCKEKQPCVPVMLYGPMMCTSDADCQSAQGANWYCDKTNTFNDGCGGTVTWPICKTGVAVPLYGPQPVPVKL